MPRCFPLADVALRVDLSLPPANGISLLARSIETERRLFLLGDSVTLLWRQPLHSCSIHYSLLISPPPKGSHPLNTAPEHASSHDAHHRGQEGDPMPPASPSLLHDTCARRHLALPITIRPEAPNSTAGATKCVRHRDKTRAGGGSDPDTASSAQSSVQPRC